MKRSNVEFVRIVAAGAVVGVCLFLTEHRYPITGVLIAYFTGAVQFGLWGRR